jgi:hypothetical protein
VTGRMQYPMPASRTPPVSVSGSLIGSLARLPAGLIGTAPSAGGQDRPDVGDVREWASTCAQPGAGAVVDSVV